MSRSFRSALAFLAAAATPLLALAQEHGGEHAAAHAEPVNAVPTFDQGFYSSVTTIVVFLVVFAVLAMKVWPTITKALDERANKIKEEIESAEMARKQAKDALDQYQKSLADARAEAQRMLDQTRQQQQALAAELKAKNEADLAAMREKATRDIESAKKAAIAEIYAQATTLSTTMAGKILRRQITAGDQQALIDESLAQLQGARG